MALLLLPFSSPPVVLLLQGAGGAFTSVSSFFRSFPFPCMARAYTNMALFLPFLQGGQGPGRERDDVMRSRKARIFPFCLPPPPFFFLSSPPSLLGRRQPSRSEKSRRHDLDLLFLLPPLLDRGG